MTYKPILCFILQFNGQILNIILIVNMLMFKYNFIYIKLYLHQTPLNTFFLNQILNMVWF